ncbi:alpha-L-fucosidase [Sporosarcina sp. NPDC096371]|uniref:alpha-L-fucosidase n=1 Tax=Sporosarcina sp. NPDC096371 TaxID=3364530 RepID=UPI0038084CB0
MKRTTKLMTSSDGYVEKVQSRKRLRRYGNRVIYSLIALMLVITSLSLSPALSYANAEPISKEVLDVSFGGVFSTEKNYTNPTGEIKDGDLTRRTGNEEIVEGRVIVKGNRDGIDLNPRESVGSAASKVIDKAIVVEAKFRPDSNPQNFNTILAVGGNLYVRYVSATEIEYGFEVNNNNSWSSVKQRVAAPEANVDHTIAIVYEPTKDGAIMRTFLNGLELPSAVSTKGGAAWSTNLGNEIGFGNDVHASALTRGFKGSFSRVVVTSFEGEFQPSLLKTMRLSRIDRSLSISGLGTLEGTTYLPVGDEIVNGNLAIQSGEFSGLGRLNMSGDNSHITFTPDTSIAEDGLLSGDYLAEIAVEPAAMKPGTVILDLAGAITLRRSVEAESIDILVDGQLKATVDLSGKLTEEFVHLSLLYRNIGEAEAEVSLLLGSQQIGDTLTLTERPHADVDTVIFAGNGSDNVGEDLSGEVYGVAFAKLEGDFMTDFLGLLGGPCVLPTGLEPGYQIEIKANECSAALAARASLVRPEPKQVEWQKYEQTAFIHYGINTYYGVEWGDLWNHNDPNMFNPTDLDTDQWARSLKDSGFKMAVLTVKHHDGFALYPSRYTDFSVGSSTWKGGNGDVLREFVNSMRKYGIKVGVYLSPSDHGAYRDGIFANGSPRSTRTIPTLVENDDRIGDLTLPSFELPATDYGAMLLNQLYEVLTEYGEIDEVWFDGAQGNIPGNKEEKYDWDSYYTLIDALAPEAVVAVTGDDVRWVGNESGWARENEWSVLGATRDADGRQSYYPSYSSPDLGSQSALAGAAANGMKYLTWWPAEVDVSIRNGWFYHDNQQPKSIDTLRNIYYQSVARNSVLLLNIPPDKRGKFADVDVKRLKDWHKSIKRDFAINHADGATIESENGATGADSAMVSDGFYETSWQSASTQPSSLTFKLDEAVKVDRVVLQEDINHGQQVESFAIDVRNAAGEWEQIYANEVIGYKRIATLSKAVTGQEFRVRILKSRGQVHLAEIGLYQTLPQGKAMAKLDGLEKVTAGESVSLNYGLSELPVEMQEGVYKQQVTIQYDSEIFEFESAELLKPEQYQILVTEEQTPGEVRVVVESKGKLMEIDEQVLSLNWKTKSNVKQTQTKINVSKATLIDRNGLEVEAVGATHVITTKAAGTESVEKDGLRNLIIESQDVHDTAVEGTEVGEYPVGSKAVLNEAIEAAKKVEGNPTSTQAQVDAASSELQSALDTFKSTVNAPTLGAAEMKTLVEQLEKEGEIKNAVAARSLTTHLTAVTQYEKQESVEKVVKHMQGFKVLLDYQRENELISDRAYHILQENTDNLIEKYQSK